MQGDSQYSGNVVSLCTRRAARDASAKGRQPAGQETRRDLAIRRLDLLQHSWRPNSRRLLTALTDLDDAVQGLGQSMSDLEGRVVQLHDSLGHALTRLEAQRQQNAQVIACLDSGDLQAMEDCRRRIDNERRKARGSRRPC